MPILNDDALDDPLTFDACEMFAGGQVSNQRPARLSDGQAAYLENVDLTRDGVPMTRRGAFYLANGALVNPGGGRVQGLVWFSQTGVGNFHVVAAGGKLYIGVNNAWQPLGDGTYTLMSAVNNVAFAQGAGVLFLVDGSGRLAIFSGGNVTDATAAQPDSNKSLPAGITLLAWITNRLVGTGAAMFPDTLFFSDFGNGQRFNRLTQSLQVGGEGGMITGIIPWTQFDLLVLKQRALWVVDCNPANVDPANPAGVGGFGVRPVSRRIGCIAPRTAVQVGADVWFLAQDGIRSVQRTQATDNQLQVGDALSEPVQDIINRINPVAAGQACAAFYNNRYIIALPLDDSTVCNSLLVYNTLQNCWSGLWTGWEVTEFCISSLFDNNQLSFSSSSSQVSIWQEYRREIADAALYQDYGPATPTTILTRAMTFGEPINPKTGFNVEFEFDARSQASVAISAVLDGVFFPLDTFSTAGNGVTPLRRNLDLQRFPPFRELQFRLVGSGGPMRLRRLSCSAFTDTLILQTP